MSATTATGYRVKFLERLRLFFVIVIAFALNITIGILTKYIFVKYVSISTFDSSKLRNSIFLITTLTIVKFNNFAVYNLKIHFQSFRYSLFVTFLHMIFSWIACGLTSASTIPKLNFKQYVQVLKLSMCFSASVAMVSLML